MSVTPVEVHGGYLVKRDDLFTAAGQSGGKVRSCLALASLPPAPAGLVTACSRHSPQAAIVAGVAAQLGVPCRVHVPDAAGPLPGELAAAQALGAVLVPARPGYNSVICARAREDAGRRRGWREVPFGMECAQAVEQNAGQAAALPRAGYDRIVVPVGSGMSLAGVLAGLAQAGNWTPVLGVQVGSGRASVLDRWGPRDWRVRARLVDAGVPYGRQVRAQLGGLLLDPVYEGKCVPFLRPGDLLWVVGIRLTAGRAAAGAVAAGGREAGAA